MSAIVKEVYDAFRSAGVSDAQATAAAQAIPLRSDLATKDDIGVLRSDIEGLRAAVNADIEGLRAAVNADIEGIRAAVNTDIEGIRTAVNADVNGLRTEITGVRAGLKGDMKELELRITVKFYTALGLVVAGIKALDFLIG